MADYVDLPEGFTIIDTPPDEGFDTLPEGFAIVSEAPPEEHPISTSYPRTRPAELRQTPERTAWDGFKSLFDDPKRESAKAIEALVNKELLKERTGLDVGLHTVYDWSDGVNRLLDMDANRKEDRQKYLGAIKTFNDTGVEDGWLESTWKSVKSVPVRLQVASGGLLQMVEEGLADTGQDMWLTGADAIRASKILGPLSISDSESVIKAAFNKREEREVRTLGGLIAARGKETLAELAPKVEPGSWKELVSNSTSSAANYIAWLGLAVVTKKPHLAIAGFTAQATGEQYPAQISGGTNPLSATIASVGYGLAEGLPEFIPMGIYMKPGLSFVKRLVAAEFAEIPAETLTTISQTVIDKVTLEPDLTVRDALSRITDTIYATVLTTGGIAGASHAMNKMIARDLPLPMKEPFNAAVKETLDNDGTPQEAVANGLEAVKATTEGAVHIDTVMANFNAEAEKIMAEEPPVPAAEVPAEPVSPEEESLTISEDTAAEDAVLDLIAEGKDIEAITEEDVMAKTGVFEQEASPIEGTPVLTAVAPEMAGQAVEPAAVDPSVRSIVDDVAGQLEATGRFTAEDAGVQAQVYGEVFRVMGKRAGIDPDKLYKKYGVNIGTGIEVSSASKKEAKAGQSLADLVRTAGGINAKKEFMTGDVQGFSFKAGNNLINNKTGKTLEQLTEYATSHGYFKERPTITEFIDALRSDVDAKISGTGTRLYSSEDMDSRLDAELEIQYAEYLEEQRLRNRKKAEPSDFLTKEEYFQKHASEIFEQAAYHGTPYKFDKFTLDHIGKGEGAQAYGWGLYFAENKDVADWYKDKLSGSIIMVGGKDFLENKTWLSARGKQLLTEHLKDAIDKGFTKSDAALEANKTLTKLAPTGHSEVYARMVYDAANAANNLRGEDWSFLNGRTYKVNLPDKSEYLDWDKPLSEQSEKVRTALAKSGYISGNDPAKYAELKKQYGDLLSQQDRLSTPDKAIQRELDSLRTAMLGLKTTFSLTGKELYHKIEHDFAIKKLAPISKTADGGVQIDQNASLYLKSIGVPGIKYLEGASRNTLQHMPITAERRAEIVARLNELQKTDIPAAKSAEDLKKLHTEHDELSKILAHADAKPQHHNFVIFDEALIEVEEYFQKKSGPARGRIAFGLEGINIELLQNADKSTFLHETGHFYLKMLENLATMEGAKKDIAADYATIRAWLKAGTGEPITVKQHEKFARGFEAYLMEGKAPSSQLKAAFERFASWLTEIYKSLTALNVRLTPEVREVMDKMLADRGEIKAQAKAEAQTADAIAQAERLKSVLPVKAVKAQIARTAGIKKVVKMIGEDEALSAAWKKAEQNARIAFRSGKKEAQAAAKAEMKAIVEKVKDKAEAKIAKILTEKQKMARRRQSVSNIQNYLGLTASNVKTLLKRQALIYPYKSDIAQMTDYEFKVFLDNLLQLSVEVQEEAFYKARVAYAIDTLQLKKVDNYREALGLPVISEMTIDQLDAFADMLEQFEVGDVFLGEREIETVDRTPLKGIRTWREAKEALAKELNVPVEKLEAIKVSELDQIRWDTALAERNPFYGLLVESMTKSMLTAEAISHGIENRVYDLARKAEKSRKRPLVERAIPQDKQIMAYLEAPAEAREAFLAELTPEQIDLAHYMKQYFADYLEYLIQTDSLEKGRENYFVHIRKTFGETLKDDGLGRAVMSIFKNYEQDQMAFTILNDKTGTILPLEKFFQYSMRRTGELDPSQNVVKSFLTYVKTAEKKRAFDAIIPQLDIYAQALTPLKLTKGGLEMDTSLKDFVYKYVNNKKGRQLSFGGVIPQGGKVDLIIRALRAFTTILDLGFSPITGSAAFVGEQFATFEMLGAKGLAIGTARIKTAKGKAILAKYEHFVGRSAWEEFNLPGKEVGERLMDGMFGLFHASTVLANKQFLLASLSEQEYNSGEIDIERLAQMKLEMGRFRVVPGTKSLVGSTSIGGMFTQYKTWAVPIARTLIQDAGILASDLKNKPFREALTTREARELFRFVATSITILIVLGMGDEKDKSFLGRLSYKLRSEALTLLSSLDPTLWTTVPRIWTFIGQLSKNLKELVLLEEYKTKPGLKGVEGLKKQFTPGALRGIVGTEEKPIARREL